MMIISLRISVISDEAHLKRTKKYLLRVLLHLDF